MIDYTDYLGIDRHLRNEEIGPCLIFVMNVVWYALTCLEVGKMSRGFPVRKIF